MANHSMIIIGETLDFMNEPYDKWIRKLTVTHAFGQIENWTNLHKIEKLNT